MDLSFESSNEIHDSLVSSYPGAIERSHPQLLKREMVKNLIDGSARVLDIGCARGAYLASATRVSLFDFGDAGG